MMNANFQPIPMQINSSSISASDVDALLSRSPVQVGKISAPRRRRPRTAIDLEEDVSNLDKDEIKKMKNRVAAARARERAQQRVADLEDMVRELWSRVQYLEGVIQQLLPSESVNNLYAQYQPYVALMDTQQMNAQGMPTQNGFSMAELEWLFASDSRYAQE